MRPFNTLIALAITASSISANAQTPESAPTVVDPVSQSYATSYGVDLSEANRRLALLSKIVDLDARLRAQAGDSYAGLYVEHTPKFRVMVRFIGDAAANLRAVTSDPLFESQSAAVTLKSLETAHARVTDLLARLGIDFEGDVNVRANGVSIFTLNDGTARSALASLLTAFPFLNLKQVSALPKRTATILGGKEATGTTIRCTTGFNVQNSSAVRGTTTAGHCDNLIAVGGTSLTFQSERYTGSYDVQWHAKSGQTFPNQIYTGSGNMAITSVYAAKSLPIGWQVCKYGITTSYTCGTVETVTAGTREADGTSGVYIRVKSSNGVQMADEGDSGGPVFGNAVAYGIVHAKGAPGSAYPKDMYFMSQENFSVLGISVVTN